MSQDELIQMALKIIEQGREDALQAQEYLRQLAEQEMTKEAA